MPLALALSRSCSLALPRRHPLLPWTPNRRSSSPPARRLLFSLPRPLPQQSIPQTTEAGLVLFLPLYPPISLHVSAPLTRPGPTNNTIISTTRAPTAPAFQSTRLDAHPLCPSHRRRRQHLYNAARPFPNHLETRLGRSAFSPKPPPVRRIINGPILIRADNSNRQFRRRIQRRRRTTLTMPTSFSRISITDIDQETAALHL